MLKFKAGVIVSKQAIIAAAGANARTAAGLSGDCLVTSGNDGQHMVGSKHFTDEALDFRTRGLTPTDISIWASNLRRRLGLAYDVVVESDHLHVEWDPE